IEDRRVLPLLVPDEIHPHESAEATYRFNGLAHRAFVRRHPGRDPPAEISKTATADDDVLLADSQKPGAADRVDQEAGAHGFADYVRLEDRAIIRSTGVGKVIGAFDEERVECAGAVNRLNHGWIGRVA